MHKFVALPAGAPELVRSSQKDHFYTTYLSGLLSDVARQLLPLRRWIRHQREIQLVAELAYYGLTTVYGNQSLGEEYCNIVQISSGTVTSFIRRSGSVLIRVLGPYVLEKLLELVQWQLTARTFSQYLSEETCERLGKVIEYCGETVSTLNQLHLAIFYLQGIFYHLSKRVTGIRYLMLRYSGESSTQTSQLAVYRTLGCLMLLQLFVRLLSKQWWKVAASHILIRERMHTFMESPPFKDPPPTCTCPLCLERCTAPTAILCGHVFCWKCAAEGIAEKMECPLCRRPTLAQQLVPLQHFTA